MARSAGPAALHQGREFLVEIAGHELGFGSARNGEEKKTGESARTHRSDPCGGKTRPSSMLAKSWRVRLMAASPARVISNDRLARPPRSGVGAETVPVIRPLDSRRSSVA